MLHRLVEILAYASALHDVLHHGVVGVGVALGPCAHHLSDVFCVHSGGEVGVHALRGVALEVGLVEGCCVHGLALYHHRGLFVVRCSVGCVCRVEPQGCRLVAVASAVAAHVLEHFAHVVGEGHHGEILRLVHEPLRVTFLGHIDGHRRASPECSYASPSYGHGVLFRLVSCAKQLCLAEPLEAVGREIVFNIDFCEPVLLLCVNAEWHDEQHCCR